MKIWSDILNPLFPEKGVVKLKWHKSVGEHNDAQIDCRLQFFHKNTLIGLTDTKATNDHYLKLVTESKDVLGFIINYSTSFDHKRISVPTLQINNNHWNVSKLYIGDDGLYCVDKYMDLIFPLNPADFAKQSCEWFQKLLSLRKHVLSLQNPLDGSKSQRTSSIEHKKIRMIIQLARYLRYTFIDFQNLYGAS